MRGFWLQQADGFVIYAGFKILSGSLDIVTRADALFGAPAFIAGASAVATILFYDLYLRETA